VQYVMLIEPLIDNYPLAPVPNAAMEFNRLFSLGDIFLYEPKTEILYIPKDRCKLITDRFPPRFCLLRNEHHCFKYIGEADDTAKYND